MKEQKYLFENERYKALCEKLIRPQFQRKLVWNKDQKKSFIDSVYNGFPFVTILVYKKEDGKYLLIDGLQRILTLQDFECNRNNYINIEQLCSSEINSIIQIGADLLNKKFKCDIDIYNNSLTPLKNDLNKLLKDFESKFNVLLSSNNYDDIIKKFPNKGLIDEVKKFGINKNFYYDTAFTILKGDKDSCRIVRESLF